MAQGLDREQAEYFVAAQFALARRSVFQPGILEIVQQALEVSSEERPTEGALVFVLDLAALAAGDRLTPIVLPDDQRLADALRGYEDHVLARILSDSRWPRCTDAIQGAAPSLRARAIGVVAAHVLGRLVSEPGHFVMPALVRRVSRLTRPELTQLSLRAIEDGATRLRLAKELERLVLGARRRDSLLSEADVSLAENIGALQTLGARVALTQLAEASERIDTKLPSRPATRVADDDEAPSKLEEESAFPVGGFSSISTVGSIENLVVSELVYMDDDVRPDLFDVRFVEQELLFYVRDESVAFRRRREVVIILDPSLERARQMDQGSKYQRIVWALASVVATFRKLDAWLGHEAVHLTLSFAADQRGQQPLAEERAVLVLLLRVLEERGLLEVRDVKSTIDEVRSVQQRHGANARTIVVASRIPDGLDSTAQPHAIVDLSGMKPLVLRPDALPGAEVTAAEADDAWVEVTNRVLLTALKRASSTAGAMRVRGSPTPLRDARGERSFRRQPKDG